MTRAGNRLSRRGRLAPPKAISYNPVALPRSKGQSGPEPVFFLNIVPEAVADLPPDRQEYGFAKRDFSFAEVGGRFERWQCTAQIRLPDYPIKEMQTGQYAPGQGPLWQVDLIIPADPPANCAPITPPCPPLIRRPGIISTCMFRIIG